MALSFNFVSRLRFNCCPGVIGRLELKPDSKQKSGHIFAASPYCQTKCCVAVFHHSYMVSKILSVSIDPTPLPRYRFVKRFGTLQLASCFIIKSTSSSVMPFSFISSGEMPGLDEQLKSCHYKTLQIMFLVCWNNAKALL